MRVVSNAGPLIALGKLGQLGVLLRLYEEILIPLSVDTEVVVNGLRLGAVEADAVAFLIRQGHIRVMEVSLPDPLPGWAQAIDLGEAETIILGQQSMADWLLIDNLHARRAARKLGLPLRGTVGVLLQAYRVGCVSLAEFELLMRTIKSRPDLWISERLCDAAWAQAKRESQQ